MFSSCDRLRKAVQMKLPILRQIGCEFLPLVIRHYLMTFFACDEREQDGKLEALYHQPRRKSCTFHQAFGLLMIGVDRDTSSF